MNEKGVSINERAYFAVIPATVRYDINLSMGARLLYGEVTALCNLKGFCWASNEYFANLYKKDERSIIRWINSLVKEGYLHKNLQYDLSGKKVIGRCLSLSKVDIKEHDNFVGGSDNFVTDSMTFLSKEHDKNVIYNNTNNNTSNNREKTASKEELLNLFTSSLIIDVNPKYSFKEYSQLSVKYLSCEWLKENIKHLSKIHKFFNKINTGFYDRYKEFERHSANANLVKRNLSSEELNEMFDCLDDDEM